MNLISWIQNAYQSFTEYVGWSKPQVQTPPPVKETAPEDVKASTLEKGENVQISKPSHQGSAAASVGHSKEEAAKKWRAADSGQQLSKFQEAVQNGVSPTTALSKSEAASKALNRSQKDNIAKFMRGVLEYGRVKESKNEDFTKMTLIQVLTKGIEKHGITLEQLELIGDGDFILSDYLTMVKNGESVV